MSARRGGGEGGAHELFPAERGPGVVNLTTAGPYLSAMMENGRTYAVDVYKLYTMSGRAKGEAELQKDSANGGHRGC